jgi:hypothetical protein
MHLSDGDIRCHMTVPLIKTMFTVKDGPTIDGTVGWTSDVKGSFPADLATYEVKLKLFDGKTFILEPDARSPSAFLVATLGMSQYRFRPRAPLDF